MVERKPNEYHTHLLVTPSVGEVRVQIALQHHAVAVLTPAKAFQAGVALIFGALTASGVKIEVQPQKE